MLTRNCFHFCADDDHKIVKSILFNILLFLSFLQRCSSLERPLSATSNSRNSNASSASARQCPSPIPAHVAKGRKKKLQTLVIETSGKKCNFLIFHDVWLRGEEIHEIALFPASWALKIWKKINPEKNWGRNYVLLYILFVCPTCIRCHEFFSFYFFFGFSNWHNFKN